MYQYMRQHEAFVRAVLASASAGIDWPGLGQYHNTQIRFMQHERLVHLLVMLFVGLFTLISVLFLAIHPSLPVALLALLLVVLLGPYVVHYFRLENGVQRWYDLANEIERRGKPGASSAPGAPTPTPAPD